MGRVGEKIGIEVPCGGAFLFGIGYQNGSMVRVDTHVFGEGSMGREDE